MGYTLETAIVFSLVLALIAFLITGPEQMAVDSFACAKYGIEEVSFMADDGALVEEDSIGDASSVNTAPERLCTFLSGVSDNYRLVYGTVLEVANGE